MKTIKTPLRFALLISLFVLIAAAHAQSENLLRNPGMEESVANVMDWEQVSFSPDAKFALVHTNAHSGKNCVSIENPTPNDSRFIQRVPVTANTSYKISGWIRTENVSTEGGGANISLGDFFYTSTPITGTNGKWEYVEFYVYIEYDIDQLTVAMRLGNFGGICSGKAYFDDVSMEKVLDIPASKLKFKVGNPKTVSNDNAVQNTTSSQNVAKKSMPLQTLLAMIFILLSLIVFLILMFMKKPS
jgi:dolichyl-phosphate-mannose-protein mannosyltransferase